MGRLPLFFLIAACLCTSGCSGCAEKSGIIPRPAEMEFMPGYFSSSNLECSGLGQSLRSYIAGHTALDWYFAEDGNIRFITSSEDAPYNTDEAYNLNISRDSIIVTAASDRGFFYAITTILQFMDNNGGKLPCAVISDRPSYPWRGLMIDVSRHFFSTDFIKKQIDAMAYLKLNRLHLHLTDAAGWRIEIDRYPELTSIAAWRTGREWKDWWFGDRKYLPEGTTGAYGGYYTKEELRDLVEYADARNITIVPEIEMPGHSEEVLAVYPELSCTGEPYRHGDFCVGKDEVYTFLTNVLDEVMEIFPSEYIHIGGDEAVKASWEKCPDCLDLMEKIGADNVNQLQSHFIHRIREYVESKGRIMIGWDEILQGGAPPSAVVMAWRSIDEGIKSANSGHMTIMAPGSHCYLNTYQDNPDLLPPAMGGYTPLSKVYAFNPAGGFPDTSSRADGRILGIQGNVWAEYIPTEEILEMMIYPRLFAIAENGWNPDAEKCYPEFRERASTVCGNMREKGYNTFDIDCEYGERRESLTPVRHLGTDKDVIYNAPYSSAYPAAGEKALTDGLRGGWTYSDGRWQGFISKDRLDVTVDLGEITGISSVYACFMQVCGPEVFLPAETVISVSNDNITFKELKRIEKETVMDDRVRFENIGWEGADSARYVRYQARSGKYGGFVFTDEIVIM